MKGIYLLFVVVGLILIVTMSIVFQEGMFSGVTYESGNESMAGPYQIYLTTHAWTVVIAALLIIAVFVGAAWMLL